MNMLKKGQQKVEVKQAIEGLQKVGQPFVVIRSSRPTEEILKYHYEYYQKIGKILDDISKLNLTPEARKITKNLDWVRRLYRMPQDQFWEFLQDDRFPYGLDKMYRVINDKTLDEKTRIRISEKNLGIVTPYGTLRSFVGEICFMTMNNLYKNCKDTEKALKNTLKPKILSMFNVFAKKKAFEKE